MNEAQRRFKIVSKPTALPGCCFVCRGEEGREWFADLNVEVNWEHQGAGYICNLCFIEIASLVGLVPVEVNEDAKKFLEELQNFDVSGLENGLNDVLGSVSDSLSMLSSIRNYLDTDASELSEPDTNVEGSDDEPIGTVPSREEGSTEPSSEQGLDDLRSTEPDPIQPVFQF